MSRKVLAFLFLLIPLQLFSQGITNYSYKFKINGLKDTVCYLGFHFGDKKYVRDTAAVNSRGEVEFKGKDTLNGGIYLLVLPNKKWFEFVINEPSFSIETDTVDFVNRSKIKGSVENTLWFDYLKYMTGKQVVLDGLRKKKEALAPGTKEFKDAEAEMQRESDEVNKYRLSVIEKNPNAFVSKVFRAMKDVDIPPAPTKADGSVDSTFQYRYYRAHYFDNIDFADDRILRTPIFEPKLTYYFEKMLPQISDTIIAEADLLLEKVRKNKEIFKFVMHTITYNYERSQIMCIDRVFVHMVDKYYSTGQCDWVDKKTLEKMQERANKLRPVLCGATVPNVILPDTAMKWHSLYSVKNDITILYFWESTCSHCKKSTPVLKELYNSYLKPKGIEIFAVEGELEDAEWKKYLIEQKLPWINVSDNPEINSHPEKYLHITDLSSLNFRHTFDLTSYPVIFILDKDKKIIGKKLGVEQLKDFLEKYMKLNKK